MSGAVCAVAAWTAGRWFVSGEVLEIACLVLEATSLKAAQQGKRLLQVIREKKPESISELARLLNCNQSNVSNDIKYLEEVGCWNLMG